ncbi:hypothetical protein MD484_g3672, partial [Candolleomyces efflorescens]
MLRTVTLVALAAYVSAQSLSSTCTSALSSIVLNTEAASCLNPVALVSIATGNTSQSIIPTIDNWLTGVCGAPACSNATLAAVVANITTGCSAELSVTGTDDAGAITTLVQQYYPTVRKAFCLKDGSTNCITQTLQNIEGVVGTLSLTNIVQLAVNPPTTLLAQNLTNITCTNCVKEIYNVLVEDIPASSSSLKSTFDEQCGATFTDGSTPSGITQSASQTTGSQTTNNDSGALSSFSTAGISLTGLVAISTVLTLLA